MTLKSAPVRATAFMKLTRATRTKPAWLVSSRTCAEHEGGADAGDEARGDEHGKVRRHGAEHVAGGGDETAQRERRAAADDVGEPADGHRDEEAREAVYGDGEADGRLRHAERARVEREDGNDAAESELVDGDQHAHPHEDARRVGTDHAARL